MVLALLTTTYYYYWFLLLLLLLSNDGARKHSPEGGYNPGCLIALGEQLFSSWLRRECFHTTARSLARTCLPEKTSESTPEREALEVDISYFQASISINALPSYTERKKVKTLRDTISYSSVHPFRY